jgi:hypothetical protein
VVLFETPDGKEVSRRESYLLVDETSWHYMTATANADPYGMTTKEQTTATTTADT